MAPDLHNRRSSKNLGRACWTKACWASGLPWKRRLPQSWESPCRGGLWDQLERDSEQMAPVMATMLRDQLSMANRLQQTVAAESKQRATRVTLEETLHPFSRWLLAEEDPSAAWLELVADAWLFLGESKTALQVYEQLLDLQSDAAPWLLGQAQCQLNLAGSDRDQLVDPMATFRRLARSRPPDKLPKVYWACQVGMLEILQHWDAISRIVVAGGTTSIHFAGSWWGGIPRPTGGFPAVELMCVEGIQMV